MRLAVTMLPCSCTTKREELAMFMTKTHDLGVKSVRF